MSAKTTASLFKDPAVVETISIIHYKYVVVPADNGPKTPSLSAKKPHYIDCLVIYLGLDNSPYNQRRV